MASLLLDWISLDFITLSIVFILEKNPMGVDAIVFSSSSGIASNSCVSNISLATSYLTCLCLSETHPATLFSADESL